MGTASVPMAMDRAETPLWFAGAAGFFFVFRAGLTFLFFQAGPAEGSAAAIAMGLALVYGAVMMTADPTHRDEAAMNDAPTYSARPVQWIAAMLAWSLSSVLWTQSLSQITALAYWAGMAADVATVLLLLRRGDAVRVTEALMRGAVWGAAGLAAVAWCSPATADLRLGNDAWLHPNTLGLELGLATLMAQHLATRARWWRWMGAALAVTLLRTLSKTAIVAFVAAECWVLLQHKGMRRAAKLRLMAAAAVVAAAFWGLLMRYFDVYTNSGSSNQVETLTGRTVLWAAALGLGLEKPWFGHGIDSFKALIPAFGTFAAVHAHNEALQQFFEFGAVGLAIATAVYASFFRLVLRAQRNELRVTAMGLLIFALVRGLADTVPFGLSFPLWLMAALAVCLTNTTRDGADR